MQNVPKIVRERLKAAATIVNHLDSHPDANVLTAFAERSLAESERAVVMGHLGRCSHCRDIVVLALPATEPAETAQKAPARAWLTWPALRWAFVAAGVIAIAALGIVQYERGVRSQSMASKAPARFEVADKEARNQPLVSPGPAATSKKGDNLRSPAAPAFADSVDTKSAAVNEGKLISHAAAPPAPVPPPSVGHGAAVGGPVHGPLPHGPRMANQWQQQYGVQNQVAAPAASSPFAKQQAAGDGAATNQVPAGSETVEVEGRSPQLDTEAQNLEGRQIDSRPSKDQPGAPPSSDYALARVDKAKPADTAPRGATTVSSTASPAAQEIDSGALALSAPVPRWTISSTGSLQRSFDQGTTWQTVDVNSSPAFLKDATSTDATSIQITAKPSRAKVRKVPSPTFRAVTASGTDVWAGGSGGALYHSSDAGDHWIHVIPATSRATLTGDIVGLEFRDPRNGRVSTSTAEVWNTNDAGQTWTKQ
jgi:hypothetical protein